MSAEQRFSAEDVEPLVRAVLDADAASFDAAKLQAAVARRLAGDEGLASGAPTTPPPALPARRRFLRRGAAAACLAAVGGATGYFLFSPTAASAYSLVESAQIGRAHV